MSKHYIKQEGIPQMVDEFTIEAGVKTTKQGTIDEQKMQVFCEKGKQMEQDGEKLDRIQEQQVESSPCWNISMFKRMFDLFQEFGTRWSLISKQMKNWSEAFLKNKFNSCLRKFTRRVSLVRRNKTKKPCKQIKFNTMVSLIHYPDKIDSYSPQAISFAAHLKKDVFEQMIELEKGKSNFQKIIELEERIHQFTMTNKTYLMNLGKKKICPRAFQPTLKKRAPKQFRDIDTWFHSVVVVRFPEQLKNGKSMKREKYQQSSSGYNQMEKGKKTEYISRQVQQKDKQMEQRASEDKYNIEGKILNKSKKTQRSDMKNSIKN